MLDEAATAATTRARRVVRRAARSPKVWALAVTTLGCVLTTSYALRMLDHERARALESLERQLTAAADDRRVAIDQWLDDQVADVGRAAASPAVVELLVHPAPDAEATARAALLRLAGASFGRTLRLFDRAGVLIAASDDSTDGVPTSASVARAALATGVARVEPQRRDGAGRRGFVFVALAAAPAASAAAAEPEPLGVVTLTVPAERWLYPFLARTPFPTASGECLLAERRDGVIRSISPLADGSSPGTVLELSRVPPRLALGAALAGQEQLAELADYRGVPVVAVIRNLRSAPWALVMKVDRADLLAELRGPAWVRTLELVGGLIALATVTLFAARSWWPSARLRAAQSEARFAALADQANDAIFMTDADGRILEANRRAESLYGYDAEELRSLGLADLSADGAADDAPDDPSATWSGSGRLVATVHVRKDGRTFPVELSRRGFHQGGELRALAVVRDLTERQTNESRIRDLNRLLRTQTLVNQALVSARDRGELLDDACRILVADGGFAIAWVGLLDPLAARLVPAALAGAAARVLDGERLRCDGSSHRIWCIAIRTGRRAVGDETALVDRAAGGAPERRTEAAFPLLVRGQIVGVLGIQHSSLAELADEDLELLDELSRDVAHGIEASLDREDLESAEAQLHEALRRARASAARFVTVFDHAPVGIGLSGLASQELEAINPTLARMLGYTPDELIGQPAASIWQPREHERRAAILSELRSGARAYADFQTEFRHRDGTSLPVHAIFTLVRGASGEPEHVLGVLEDERERRAADVRIRQLSRAVEQSPVSVVITDRSGTIDYVNRKFTEVTGYTAEEAVGRNPRILKSGDRDLADYHDLWTTITSGGDWRGEFHNRRKNGELFWEDAVISPLRDENGQITHFVAVKEDITARKAAEDELRRVQAHLAAAQKMDAIGRLAGGVAHDFNNLLTVILGFGELMLSDLSPADPHYESVAGVMDAAKRASELTRQLLAFSRREVVVRRVLDVSAVLANLEKMLRRLVGEHIEVATDFPAGLAHVEADPGQLEQIVVNLAVNARDAMPDGGSLHLETASVTLEAGAPELPPDVSPGTFVRVRIADTGAGLTAEVRERMFEPFFTTKARGRGTGLGLATVYGIVHNGGGFIDVSSEVGRGTRFDVYLPAIDKPISTEAAVGATDLPGGDETVLIVEDDEMVRTISARMLRAAGYRVLVAANPGEAYLIATEQREKLDLMITDVVMPLMSGRALAEKLKEQLPELPVIYMSGYTDDELLRRAVISDEVKFLQKPVSRATLLRAVRGVLDREATSRRAR